MQTIQTRYLRTGQEPLDWKKAKVVPIYEKGSKHLAVNYRPVSLTCICSKVLEHIVASKIYRHLKKHNIIAMNKHGFRFGFSCETQLLEFVLYLQWHNYRDFQVNWNDCCCDASRGALYLDNCNRAWCGDGTFQPRDPLMGRSSNGLQ